MGFLRRALGGSSDPIPDRMLGLARQAVAANGSVYARATCPYCEAVLAKLPGRSGKCPTCAAHIAYVRGADDLVYLVRDTEADLVRSEVEKHWALYQEWAGRQRPVESLRGYGRLFRARYAALGVRVWVRHGDEPCRECRTLHGHPLDPSTAPDLPLRECRRLYCFCRYAPSLGDESPF